MLGGGIGTVILVVLYLLRGGDPLALFNSQQAQLPQSAQFDSQAPRDEASKFVAVVLADTEDAWNESFGKWADRTKSRGSCSSPT